MPTHTRPPWSILAVRKSPSEIITIYAGDLQIADVVGLTPGTEDTEGEDTYLSYAENRANARLIVQAVNSHADLLTALETFLLLSDHDDDYHPSPALVVLQQTAQAAEVDTYTYVERIARAAITKARGES